MSARRRLARPLTLLAAAALPLASCEKRPPAPRVVLAETRHDFGKLWIGEVRTHAFALENRGALPLELGEVRSSCGCLLLQKLSTRTLAPGERGELVVELHADKAPGPLVKELSVGTNDPAQPRVTLTLAALLATLFELEPPLLDAQDLVLGEPRDLTIALRVTDGSALALGAPRCDEAGFAATARALAPDRAEVVVRFAGDAFPGRRLFRVQLPTGHPLVPEASLPVQAVVLSRLVVDPAERVELGDIARASGKVAELRVRRRGTAPLPAEPTVKVELAPRRDGASPAPPQVSARLEPVVAGEEWKLLVEVAPGSPGSSLVGRVSVALAAPHEPPHTLTLTGRILD